MIFDHNYRPILVEYYDDVADHDDDGEYEN